jgi:hypothetical protein
VVFGSVGECCFPTSHEGAVFGSVGEFCFPTHRPSSEWRPIGLEWMEGRIVLVVIYLIFFRLWEAIRDLEVAGYTQIAHLGLERSSFSPNICVQTKFVQYLLSE